MHLTDKETLKKLLGSVPLTAELDWLVRRRGAVVHGFTLEQLSAALPAWQAQAAASPFRYQPGNRVLIFGMLRYWISHLTLLGLALAGLGHRVDLAYLPYDGWQHPENDYDLRQQNLYGRRVLQQAEPMLEAFSMLDQRPTQPLPPAMKAAIESLSVRDTQYTLQVEEVGGEDELFQLRLARNTSAAQAALQWMQQNQPDAVLLPNGWILEFGAVYLAAQHLGIPVVTFEFGEQRDRVWLSQSSPVMLQDTTEMWIARKHEPITQAQLEQVRELYAARQGASLFRNFYRQWQGAPSEGAEQVRAKLGLDGRPVILLAANVIGDSLTLGRQVFTESMTDWLQRTLDFLADSKRAQLVIRAHPGELALDGPSIMDVLRAFMPEVPEHVHLIAADDPVNTYDLISIADLGLTYTTTVGMEMAMSGVPVIAVGNTHYRGKGFTLDPTSWQAYFAMLEAVLADPQANRPNEEQVRCAWQYAYRFFFDYPMPFPWHLLHFWDDVETWPLSRVLTSEGLQQYGRTFDSLAGNPVDWTAADSR